LEKKTGKKRAELQNPELENPQGAGTGPAFL